MQLYYQKFGSGKPLVILHGLFGSSDNWATFARQLSSELPYEIYTVDLRNHGRSPHHYSFSMEALVDDLQNFLVKNSIESPVLFGHSLGGKVILNYLKEPFSSDVKSSVIVDIGLRNYSFKQSHSELLTVMKNSPVEEFTSRVMAEEYFSKLIPSVKMQQIVVKNLKRSKDNGFLWKLNLSAIDTYVDDLLKGVVYQEKNLVKTLFIKGELSDYITMEDETLIKHSFENAKIVSVQNAGHWVHADNPDALLNEVVLFLKEL